MSGLVGAVIVRFLRQDLRQALVRGATRDPPGSATGTAWTLAAALAYAAIAVWLYWHGGYHAGFAPLNAWGRTLPDPVWQWLTVLGDERIAFVLPLFFARHRPRIFWTLICAGLVATAYSRGLKPLVDALRPPAVLPADALHLIGEAHRRLSFPSGHSAVAGVLFGTLAYYANGVDRRLLLLGIAAATAISRVAVGVHWPVDVAAGLAGGLLAVPIGVRLARASPWGVYDGAVHLAFITLGLFAAVGLLLDDGGYPAATPLLMLLGAAGLGHAALIYGVLPLTRAWLGRGGRPLETE
jgi:membrane-associated phospholipid phosphatase